MPSAWLPMSSFRATQVRRSTAGAPRRLNSAQRRMAAAVARHYGFCREVGRFIMTWQMLVPFAIPLATAFVAFRRTGIERLLAIVATLAATGHYAIPLLTGSHLALWPGLDEFILSTVSLSLFAVGLVAIMMLMAGRLWHPAQWLAVGIGVFSIATFFAHLWLLLASVSCQQLNLGLLLSKTPAAHECTSAGFLSMSAAAILLPFAGLMIMGVPKAVDAILKAQAERARLGAARRRWHPAQWLAIAVGALLFTAVLVLVYLDAIAKDPAVVAMTVGLLIGALGPRLVGWFLKMGDRDPQQVVSRRSGTHVL
jgi:hypothetical protein